MKDLKLNLDTDDLAVENLDLQLTEDADQVHQNLFIRLNFFFGEWFLDNRLGIKYFDTVFTKNPDIILIDSLIKSTILSTKGVTDLLEYESEFNVALRKLTIAFKVLTEYGELSLSEVVSI